MSEMELRGKLGDAGLEKQAVAEGAAAAAAGAKGEDSDMDDYLVDELEKLRNAEKKTRSKRSETTCISRRSLMQD